MYYSFLTLFYTSKSAQFFLSHNDPYITISSNLGISVIILALMVAIDSLANTLKFELMVVKNFVNSVQGVDHRDLNPIYLKQKTALTTNFRLQSF
jgi:hypothetical protein